MQETEHYLPVFHSLGKRSCSRQSRVQASCRIITYLIFYWKIRQKYKVRQSFCCCTKNIYIRILSKFSSKWKYNFEFGWTVLSNWVLFACLCNCSLQCRGPLSTSSPLPSIFSVLGSPTRTAVWKLPFSLPAWRATLLRYSRHGGAHGHGMGGRRRRPDPGQTRDGGRKSPVPSGMGKCERVLRTCVIEKEERARDIKTHH